MKKFKTYWTLLSLMLVTGTISAQGIEFFHGTFAEAQQAASRDGKLIFMDAFTTWCGPCKWMSANTFPDATAGRFFNDNFINIKVDMEKGEGPELARRFSVNAYPTLVFADGNGKLVHKDAGARDASGLIKLGKEALDKSGDNRPNTRIPDPDDPIVVEIPGPGDEPEEFEAFEPEKPGTPDTESIEDAIGAAIESKDLQQFEALSAELLDSDHPQREMVYLEAQKAWTQQNEDARRFVSRVDALMRSADMNNADLLNNAAWYYYELVQDRAALEKAAEWAIRSVRLAPAYYNLDTYAMLQHRLGNTDMAIVFAKYAIDVAKREGKDYADTAKALADMEGGYE